MLAIIKTSDGTEENVRGTKDIEVQNGALIVYYEENLGENWFEPVKLIKAPGEWQEAFTTWDY